MTSSPKIFHFEASMTKAAHFEAKKHAYRQCQDGIVISFVVHPNDVSAELATAPLGTRYMVAFAAIGDDEKPKQEKPRRRFDGMPRSQQAGLMCADPQFQSYCAAVDSDQAAQRVRKYCMVKSRTEFDKNTRAAERWDNLLMDFYRQTGRIAELRG